MAGLHHGKKRGRIIKRNQGERAKVLLGFLSYIPRER